MSPLAATARDLGELFREPALTVACVLLIVVSVAWMVVTRIIVRRMKKALRRGIRPARIDIVQPPKDVWSYPPPRRK
jgi:hypothetical protein